MFGVNLNGTFTGGLGEMEFKVALGNGERQGLDLSTSARNALSIPNICGSAGRSGLTVPVNNLKWFEKPVRSEGELANL